MNGKRQECDDDGLPRHFRWRTFNAFVDRALGNGLTPAAVAVWIALFRHAKRDGRVRLAQAHVARIVGRSVRAVRTALEELAAAKLLTKIVYGEFRREPSWYIVHAPAEADN